MSISIVFPAYNEEQNITLAVEEALSYLKGKEGEVIVVNDGSKDRTGLVCDELAQRHTGRVRILHHAQNMGYAAALRNGFLSAKSEWIFYSDADLQFKIQEIDLLLPHSNGADMVVGYRHDRQDPPFRIFAARCYNGLVRLFFGLRGVRDIDCAFKLFHRTVFEKIQIESKHFLIDAEILLKAHRKKMVIREVPVTHLPRKYGESTVRFRHVVNTLSGLFKLFFELRKT